MCPSSTPLSFIDFSASCVHTQRPNTFTSNIFLWSSGEPSVEQKCELFPWKKLQGVADTFLTRPTSQFRRTESILSLENGVCSCAALLVFFWHRGWKEACQATCAISTTSRHELSYSFFSSKAKRRRKFTWSDRNIRGTSTIVCHRQNLCGPG